MTRFNKITLMQVKIMKTDSAFLTFESLRGGGTEG